MSTHLLNEHRDEALVVFPRVDYLAFRHKEIVKLFFAEHVNGRHKPKENVANECEEPIGVFHELAFYSQYAYRITTCQ